MNDSLAGRIALTALLFVTSALAVTLVRPTPTFACSCGYRATPTGGAREFLLQGDLVIFRGEVVEPPGAVPDSDSGNYAVTFQVREYWKGSVTGSFTVYTSVSAGACGLSFQAGEEWLIYAYIEPSGDLVASLCSRSSRIPGGMFVGDLTVLGPGTPVAEPSSEPPREIPATGNTREVDRTLRYVAVGLTLAGVLLVLGVAAIARQQRTHRL